MFVRSSIYELIVAYPQAKVKDFFTYFHTTAKKTCLYKK